MITPATFRFLKDLKANNNRDWFNANKTRYESAKQEFEDFLNALLPQIAVFDTSIAHQTAKDCMFRIYRDVRFSKDKSPYKTHLGAYISKAGKKNEIHGNAGYYIHLEDQHTLLAGGAYVPASPWLKAIRQEIDYNAEEFKKLLKNKNFKTYFGEIEGEKLIRPPKGYDAEHPEIEFLKMKSFLATHTVPNKTVTSDAFLSHCAKVFRTLSPFNQFLNRAIE